MQTPHIQSLPVGSSRAESEELQELPCSHLPGPRELHGTGSAQGFTLHMALRSDAHYLFHLEHQNQTWI